MKRAVLGLLALMTPSVFLNAQVGTGRAYSGAGASGPWERHIGSGTECSLGSPCVLRSYGHSYYKRTPEGEIEP